MGFWADLFGISKEEKETGWRGIICDPGIDTRPATNSYVTDTNAELVNRLNYLTSLLNGYFRDIWGVICPTPESRTKFVYDQNQKLIDTITEYHQVRQKLGYPFEPLQEVPDENLFKKNNNYYTDSFTQLPAAQEPFALQQFDQNLALEKEKWKKEVELKKIEMEGELRKYEIQLQVQSKNYELQLEVERLRLEVERLTYLLKYQN